MDRRGGELLREMAANGERDDGRGNRNPALKSQDATPKLADLGVTKSQSSQAKAACAHGEWLPWLVAEFAWSNQTARRFIQAFENLGKSNKLLNLDLPISALYALAAPSTPEPARAEVIERAESGETLTRAEVDVPARLRRTNFLTPAAGG